MGFVHRRENRDVVTSQSKTTKFPSRCFLKEEEEPEVYIFVCTKTTQNWEARSWSTWIDNSLIWKSYLYKDRWWHYKQRDKGLRSPKERSSFHRNFKHMVMDTTLQVKVCIMVVRTTLWRTQQGKAKKHAKLQHLLVAKKNKKHYCTCFEATRS